MISTAVHSVEFENPYVNKNIDTHVKEFLTYEILAEFHKSIDTYNKERKELPEIQSEKNLYVLRDKNNKVEFTINLALKGDFYYNGVLSNIKNLKAFPAKKTVFNLLIDEAVAQDAIMSEVLLAALWKIDTYFTFAKELTGTGAQNIKIIKEKLSKYQQACTTLAAHGDHLVMGKNKEQRMLNNLFQQMSNNKNNEAKIVSSALGTRDPNCSKTKRDLIGARQYGSGISDSTAEALGGRTDSGICSALEQLKSCIVNIYHLNINEGTRNYFKEKENTTVDDLKQYAPDGRQK